MILSQSVQARLIRFGLLKNLSVNSSGRRFPFPLSRATGVPALSQDPKKTIDDFVCDLTFKAVLQRRSTILVHLQAGRVSTDDLA